MTGVCGFEVLTGLGNGGRDEDRTEESVGPAEADPAGDGLDTLGDVDALDDAEPARLPDLGNAFECTSGQ